MKFIIYMYKTGMEMAPGRPAESERRSVADDELVHTPVLIAPIRQVPADDDGDLPGPVVGEVTGCEAGALALRREWGGGVAACHISTSLSSQGADHE